MKWEGGGFFRAVIPAVPFGANVVVSATCVDRHGNTGTSLAVSFAPQGYPPLSLAITTLGQGDVTIQISSPGDPNVQEFLLVSTQQPIPVGSGPLFGVGADAFGILFYPTGFPPLHDFLNSAGNQLTAFPPASLPVGFTFDARAVLLTSPLPKASNLIRMTL
jgi:hypothetical protein